MKELRWFSCRYLLLILGSLLEARAQLSIGATIGAAAADDVATNLSVTPGDERLLVGPSLRLRMQSGVGLEAGAFYKRLSYDYAFFRIGVGGERFRAKGTIWQFPLLVQYGREWRGVVPYASAGPVIRRINGTQAGESCRQLPTVVCTPFARPFLNLEHKTTAGVQVGGGVEFRAALLRLSPEVRFTRWPKQPFVSQVMNYNEVQLLLRIAIPAARQALRNTLLQ